MLDEFKERLLKGDSPSCIANDLTNKAETERIHRLKEIEQSKIDAKYIEYGLKQPKGSIPREIAEAFIHQFEEETGLQRIQLISERLADAGKGENSNE